jgi:hypothetical protein
MPKPSKPFLRASNGELALDLALVAKAGGKLSSELLPPIRSDALRFDFDRALLSKLYRFEQEQEFERMQMQARMTALGLARILAPL